jgi:hypothetical protein
MDPKTGNIEHQRRAVCVLVLLFLISLPAEAQAQKEMQLKWSELNRVIYDQKIALVLSGGTRLEGKVLAVGREALRLRVSRASDKKV